MVAITIFYLCSCADSLSGNSEYEKELFQRIKTGMSQDDVKKILGEPDFSKVDSLSHNHYYNYYFTKNKNVIRSELPYVMFDSTNKVLFSTYGD
jgi:outer membrane protein assembly factor BamE (lipoprotein component of BamABCDE complex)